MVTNNSSQSGLMMIFCDEYYSKQMLVHTFAVFDVYCEGLYEKVKQAVGGGKKQ